MAMELRFLDFDTSEDDAGRAVFDAMASVRQAQLAALQSEVATVLAWAHGEFGEPGPIDEDGEWDFDLSGATETSVAQVFSYEASTRQLTANPGQPGVARHVVNLSVTGTPTFCAAFRAQFQIDA
jgi:VCBS repeat-containing protein